MFKIILKVLWIILVITVFILCLYFLTNGGWDDLINLSRDNGGFFKGFAQFWVDIWEGIKAIFA